MDTPLLQEKLYTIEEFQQISQLPENELKRLELVDGKIVEMASSSKINTIVAMKIGRFIGNFVDEHDLGYVTGADGSFELDDRNVKIPNAAFISKTRVASLDGVTFSVAPDLAVEVISESETARKIREKVQKYLQAGTKLVWAVYPDDKAVDVYTLNSDGSMRVKTLAVGDTLDGDGVLPGFQLPVKKIFPEAQTDS